MENDTLFVEWRPCCDCEFLVLNEHPLVDPDFDPGPPEAGDFFEVMVDLPVEAEDDCIDLQFRTKVTTGDEGAWIDDVALCGLELVDP